MVNVYNGTRGSSDFSWSCLMSCWKNVRISLQHCWYLSKRVFLHAWWSHVPVILFILSFSPALSFCTLDMQDGKRPVKSGAVCMCWPASKMSSRMLNSWVVPIWPQVWVLLFFSLGNLINSEIKDQPSTLYNFVKICKCIHNLLWAERRDSRQIGCIQIITGKPFCPKQVTKAPHYPKLPILICFQ